MGLAVEELKLLGLHVLDCCLIQQWDVRPWNSFSNTDVCAVLRVTYSEPPNCLAPGSFHTGQSFSFSLWSIGFITVI